MFSTNQTDDKTKVTFISFLNMRKDFLVTPNYVIVCKCPQRVVITYTRLCVVVPKMGTGDCMYYNIFLGKILCHFISSVQHEHQV